MAKKELSFLEQIEEKFSHLLMTDDEEHEVKIISTGSISLNYSTGIGGIPRGRFTEIYGAESSGKTTLALSIARHTINDGGKVLYIDAENGLDTPFIKQIIPEYTPENFVRLQPEFAEDAFELAEKGIKSKEFMLIVLDSISAQASKKEMEKDFGEDSMMVMPKLISKFIKRNIYSIRETDTAFVFISQVRDKVGAYVPTVSPTGGHSILHSCSLIIQLTALQGRDEKLMDGDEQIGSYIKFVVKKNKLALPYKTFSYPLLFGKGIDYARDLIVFSEVLGVTTRAGAYYRYEDVNIGQGIENTINALKENEELLDKIEEQVYTIMRKENVNGTEADQDSGELSSM